MSQSNKGKDFLFSDDCGFINGDDGDSYRYSDGSGYYHGADGSEGYIYSDGSGYYHGADGSDGYIYSDGSAYFHGADGTDAYKYSDGSGYYHGADGSDGYKYSDGSGYYNDSDGGSNSYYADDSDDDDSYSSSSSDSDITLAEGLAGLAMGLGAVAFAKHSQKAREERRAEQERQREAERIAAEKRAEEERTRCIKRAERKHERNIKKKRMKALLFNGKKIQIDFSTNDLLNKEINSVLNGLKEAGFNNYKSIAIKDIYTDTNYYVGQVHQVVIGGQSWVEQGSSIPYDSEIIVTYHAKKEFAIPYAPRNVSKRNYEELAQEFLDIGFTEVYTCPLRDLKVGWLVKENTVGKVTIGSNQNFTKGKVYDYDTKILIEYHSFNK